MYGIIIKNKLPVQENFRGNGAVYHGYAGLPDERGRIYGKELCELELKRVADMKLKIARTFYNWYAYDKKTGEWDWNNPTLTAFYRWLEGLKNIGTEVMLSIGWWLPKDLVKGNFLGASPFYVEGDWDATVLNYAKWVSEEVHQLIELRGFTNIKYLVLFTEPNNPSNTPEAPLKHQYELWKDCAEAVDKQLKTDGRRHLVKLMGPNVASREKFNSDMLNWVLKNASDCLDVISAHSYQQTRRVNPKYIKSGLAAASFSRAGGRLTQTAELQGGKDYTLTVELMGKMPDGSPISEIEHSVKLGAFKYEGKTDIWAADGSGLAAPLTEGSVTDIFPTEITTDYKKFSLSFKAEADCKTNVGFFYDFTDNIEFYLDNVCLTAKGENKNLLKNGNFYDLFNDWEALFAGGVPYYYLQWKNSADKCRNLVPNKEFCYDEYNTAFDLDRSRKEHGMEICSAAVAFMNAGLEFSLLWTLFDQQWPNNDCTNADGFVDGDHRWGTMPLLTRSLTPYPSYYAFSLISRYVDRDVKIYEGVSNGAVCATMAENKQGEITVIAVNGSEFSVEFKIEFEKEINKELFRHLFDPNTLIPDEKAEIIKADKVFYIANSFSDTLPPYGVAVYTNIG